MVKFTIAFIFKPDFGTAMYSTFALSFYSSWFFIFSGGCTDLYKKWKGTEMFIFQDRFESSQTVDLEK